LILCGVFLAGAGIVAEAIAPWSGVLIVSCGYYYACLGMETSLFLFLLSISIYCFWKKYDNWLPVLLVCTCLTRFEGVILAAIIVVLMAIQRRFPRWQSFIPAAGIVAAYFVFNLHFYGSVLPVSASAKFAQGRSGYWGQWPRAFLHLSPPIKQAFAHSIYVLPAICILMWVGLWRWRRSSLAAAAFPFCALLFVISVLLNIPDYHWYYAPFIYFGTIFAVLALPLKRRLVHALLLLSIAEVFVTSIFYVRVLVPNADYMHAALWLRAHASPSSVVAAPETGTIGWYWPYYVDDVVGLTTPGNAERLEHHDLYSWLEAQRPDYVVVHPLAPILGEVAAVQSPQYSFVGPAFGKVRLMHRNGAAY
jgi:hypothetical protein